MSAYNAGDSGLIPGSGRSPGEGMQSTPAPLPGKSHGRRSLIGYSPWGRKELDTTAQLHFHFLKSVPIFNKITSGVVLDKQTKTSINLRLSVIEQYIKVVGKGSRK